MTKTCQHIWVAYFKSLFYLSFFLFKLTQKKEIPFLLTSRKKFL